MTWWGWLLLYGVGVPVMFVVALLATIASGRGRHRGHQPTEPIAGPPPTPPGYWRDANWALHRLPERNGDQP